MLGGLIILNLLSLKLINMFKLKNWGKCNYEIIFRLIIFSFIVTLLLLTVNYAFINLLISYALTFVIFLFSSETVARLYHVKQLNAQIGISLIFISRWFWYENNLTLFILACVISFIYALILFRCKIKSILSWVSLSIFVSIFITKVFIWLLSGINEIWFTIETGLTAWWISYFFWDNALLNIVGDTSSLQPSRLDNLVFESSSFDSSSGDEASEQTALIPQKENNSSNLNIFQKFWKSKQKKAQRLVSARRNNPNEGPLLEYCIQLVQNPPQPQRRRVRQNRTSRRHN